VKYRHL